MNKPKPEISRNDIAAPPSPKKGVVLEYDLKERLVHFQEWNEIHKHVVFGDSYLNEKEKRVEAYMNLNNLKQ